MWQCILTLCVSALLWSATGHAAGSLRCGARIVQEGQRSGELLAHCGEPDYRDAWGGGGWGADVEEWYYNFGPSQLLRIVRLRNGRIASIEADGYGYHQDSAWRCTPGGLVPGLSKFRLLRLCGEPMSRRSLSVLRPVDPERYGYPPGYGQMMTPVFREEWIYNFGSSYLLRIVTLENGRVVEVDNGSRGFAPR